MANKKAGKKQVRKLTKLGKKSLAVTLPRELVKSLGWREKQRVKVRKVNGALVVRDARTKGGKRKRK